MKLKQQSMAYKIFFVLNIVFMLFIIVVMLFPYLNVLAKALNDGADSARGGITLFPRKFTLDNFKTILTEDSFFNSAVVSVVRVAVSVVLGVAVQFSAAYALAKKKFPFKAFLTLLLMLPGYISAGQIPTYVLISNLKLMNTFWVYILPGLFSFYNVIVFRTFIQTTVPDALPESARIDGAGEITIMARIVLPLCKPVLATVALWIMVASWNDWTTTLMYIRKPSLYTLQYKMMQLVKESERLQKLVEAARETGQDVSNMTVPTSDALISAQVIVSTLPIVCVYPFLQKYFVKGITLGAVKG